MKEWWTGSFTLGKRSVTKWVGVTGAVTPPVTG
jgi:hypothetical protein